MSKVLDTIKEYKHQFENGKNFYAILPYQPEKYIKQISDNISQRCKNLPVPARFNISNDFYRIIIQEIKLKTQLLEDYRCENPQNRISYWWAVFDTLIKFVRQDIKNNMSWPNNAAKQQFEQLLDKATNLTKVILHETPIEKDYDATMGGMLYIRDYHGIKPASTKYFKHLMVSDEEINTIKKLMEIFDKIQSCFILQYNVNSTTHAGTTGIMTFVKQENLTKHNMRTLNRQHIRGM